MTAKQSIMFHKTILSAKSRESWLSETNHWREHCNCRYKRLVIQVKIRHLFPFKWIYFVSHSRWMLEKQHSTRNTNLESDNTPDFTEVLLSFDCNLRKIKLPTYLKWVLRLLLAKAQIEFLFFRQNEVCSKHPLAETMLHGKQVC